MNTQEAERERRFRLAREFEESGETRADYARRVGLAPATLDYYRRRAREETAGVRWVEVEPSCPEAPNVVADLVLVLGENLRVEVGAGFEAATLARLLGVLEGRR